MNLRRMLDGVTDANISCIVPALVPHFASPRTT